MNYEKFKIGDLFLVKSNPQLDKENFTFTEKSKYPYFTRTINNNGIFGYVDYLDEKHLIKGNSIAVGMLQMKFFYMDHDFYAGQFTKTIYPKFEHFNEKIAKYFITWFNKYSEKYKSVLVRDFTKEFYDTELILPVDQKNNIDFKYIERIMDDLENDELIKIHNFLKKNGYENVELTIDEKEALTAKHEYNEFRFDEIFEKISVKKLPYKAKQLSKIPDSINCLPALTAGIDNQGLSCYVPYDKATILNDCISVSANGANTGTMFYQPYDFTVLQDSYAIKPKSNKVDSYSQIYMMCSMQKVIKGNYDWTNKAGWERIRTKKVMLPINGKNEPDYIYMSSYMKAQEKLVIKEIDI